jgi:hypothetical protein
MARPRLLLQLPFTKAFAVAVIRAVSGFHPRNPSQTPLQLPLTFLRPFNSAPFCGSSSVAQHHLAGR